MISRHVFRLKALYRALKRRWGVNSSLQVALILTTFAIAGLTALYIRHTATAWLGFNQHTPVWEEAAVWIIFVIPSYHVVLLLYGAILGQYQCIRQFQKDNIRWIRNLISKLTPNR